MLEFSDPGQAGTTYTPPRTQCQSEQLPDSLAKAMSFPFTLPFKKHSNIHLWCAVLRRRCVIKISVRLKYLFRAQIGQRNGGGHKQQKTVNLESTNTTNNSHCYWFSYQVAAVCIWGSLQTWRQKLSPIAPIGPPWGQLEHSLIANTHQMCGDLQYKNIGGHRESWKYIGFPVCGHGNQAKHSPFNYDFDINPVFNDKANHNYHCVLE